MKKSLIGAIIALVTISAIGCCPCRKASKADHKPLSITTWSLTQIDGRNITSYLKAEERPRLILAEDGSFGGYGGCNSMGGSYVVTPTTARSMEGRAGTIKFDNLFSTKRYCPNDQLEMEFFRTLAKVDAFTIEGDKLMLLKDGELKLVFEN